MPEPPDALSPEAQSRLEGVQARLGETASAQASMPDADSNVSGARGAVTEPPAETAARAQGALVEALGQRPEPSPEIEQLCERIREVIHSRRPVDESALTQADPEASARAAGGELNQSIQGDSQRVQGSYDQMSQPPAGTPAQTGEALTPQPEAQPTAGVNAAAAVPDAVPAESVSLDADVEANHQRMADAGMDSEPAQLVESGPVAEARSAQGELEETAERDPAEVLAEQQAAIDSAHGDMAGLQERALVVLTQARTSTTSGVERQQSGMVGSEEQMRADVGRQAQAIFEGAQTQVENLLRDLPQTAMRRWDAGVARLSEEFRGSLRRVQRWIDERHSGAGGAVLEVWDAVTGLPGWVTEEYDRAERQFGDDVCELLREISREVNGVIAACEAIIEQAHTDIDALYDSLPAELQEWAAGERARFAEQLDGLSQRAQAARSSITRDISNRASQAVDDVRRQIADLRARAGGLVGRIVNAVNQFLEDPVRFIINGLLELVGIPPASFWALVDRIQQVIADIANDPMNFVNNLVAALRQGFQQFFDNIGSHLLNGLLNWLFSAMGSVGVTLPADFSLGSMMTFFLQLMGITWARIRQILARHIGEQNVALIEQAWQLVSTLIERGPAGIFEMIREQLNPQTILDMIIQAAIDMITQALIRQVAVRILGLLNPAGAIAQAIELIYRVLSWVFQNAARIFTLIETVVNGAAQLIAGNISGMAAAVEGALARIIPIVIDFLAGYMGLGDLPERIADQVRRLQGMVERILDRVIGWLAGRARALLRALGVGQQDEAQPAPTSVSERWAQGMAQVRTVAHQASQQSLPAAEVNRRLQPIKTQYNFRELIATQHNGELQIHAVMNPDDWIDIAEEDEQYSEQSFWESIAAQVTTSGPPEIKLSPSSASHITAVLNGFVDRSPATAARKATVRGVVAQRIRAALDATDSHQIYVFLQQAGGIVNDLYATAPNRPSIQVHHEQEVAEFPDTFVETRTQRIYVSRRIRNQVRQQVNAIPNLTANQREQRYNELIRLIKEQIFDEQRRAMQAPLDEIDLIALPQRVHADIHRRRGT